MSFGGFGFGQNNNNNNNQQQQQQNTGFGGFGQNTQPTGFGSSGGFGATNTNTGGGLFGNTSGGFGSGGGGFGSTSTSGFGAPKPAFGTATTSSGGGLFGSSNTNTATSGAFGGFGGNNTNNNTTAFGSSTGGGGLFGGNKPAFGASTTNTSGSLFGGGGTGSFGATSQAGNTGFGSTTSGFGAGAAQPNQNNGTGSVQFEPHREKEGTQTSVFHSITMQQPYQQFSFEELRLADYQQGKKYGNTNGQAGAFGQSTGFGGFGSTNNNTSNTGTGGGLFGNNQQQQTNTGFGGTSGGLFGAKPATGGGLFGSTPASSAPSGGLFGGTSTAGGFGSGTATGFGSSANTSGGLFGAQQNKPAFGGFGSSSTPAFGQSSGTTGFGQTATSSAGGGLFGSGGTTSFGQQNNSTGFGGGFGSNNQQQQQQNTQTGGGLFGGGGGFGGNAQQQQNKPGGLFGSTQPATGGGLFGSQPQQQQQQSGGLFGNTANNQQQSGGLFGSKPATTSTGLFGNTSTANTGGGLFGNTGQQNQGNTGGGLFGSSTTNQTQQKPSLFGGLGQSTNTNTGGGLFGGLGQSSNTQPQGGSLFGNTQPQQQSGGLFGSSLGQSQQAQPQQPPQLTASLAGVNPYGNDQLFASLGMSAPSPGPIATPLSGQPKARKPALLPQHKMTPLGASRLITPQKRTTGFGFSYSTYGTPGSAIGTPTGFGNSLLSGGSLGRSLSKSFSASNLRNIYNAETSNLAPGLFTPGRNTYGSGNMKRLSINRNLDTRRSLFADDDDATPRKKVLFEESAPGGSSTPNGTLNGTSGALVRTEEASPQSTVAESPEANGHSNGASNHNGSLVTVPEEEQPAQAPASGRADAAKEHARRMQIDQNVGDYWSRPPLKELQNMSRGELKHVHLVVGRDGIGQIDFGEVDLTDTPLDKLIGHIVNLEMRHATVYGENSSIQKPAPGKALNVPSEITLENSWPRKSGGRIPVYEKHGALLDKHIVRLSRVNGAEFVNYDANTGAWTFRVQHYTTYGLDYDDDDDTMMSGAIASEVASQSVSKQNVFAAAEETPQDDTMADGFGSSPDDTFDFRQGKPQRHVPGNFDEEDGVDFEDEEEMEELDDSNQGTPQSFLGDGSVGPLAVRDDDYDIDGYAPEDREEMAGTFPVQPTEPDLLDDSPIRPKSILKNSHLGRSRLDTPSKNRLVLEANWTEQLQRTASPRKQTRQALRESQATALKPTEAHAPASKSISGKKSFSTSIDIMNSLFGRKEPTPARFDGRKQDAESKGFEWPYTKRAKFANAFDEMDEMDVAFHKSMKPSWGPDGRLVYATPADAPPLSSGVLANVDDSIVGEHTDVRFAKFASPEDLLPQTVQLQQAHTEIHKSKDAVPRAATSGEVSFADFAAAVDGSTPNGRQEKTVWSLASILFDDLPNDSFPPGLSPKERAASQGHRRKDALSRFWKGLAKRDVEPALFKARTNEEKALHHLSAGDVPGACQELVSSGNFKLASMLAQVSGADLKFRDQIRKQLQHWGSIDSLSEMTEAIRAFYEILAGNTAEVAGKGGHPENQIRGFSISQRFGFDWKRAFGLRLWYEVLPGGSIEDAVLAYQLALDDDKELVRPLPSNAHTEKDDDSREDLLWGLLRLYAAQQSSDVHVRIESVFDPANVSDNPTDARLCWQLLQVCLAKGIGGSGDLDLAADSLASTYATALASAIPDATPDQQPQLLYTALFVLSHLSDEAGRHGAVQDLLNQTAPLLTSERQLNLTLPHTSRASRSERPSASTTTLPDALTSPRGLSIPPAWLAAALALWAKAVDRDPAAQARHLLDAGRANDAHAVLLHQIGPSCIVRRDHDTLREVLGGFEGHVKSVAGWRTGGGVYFDFVHLGDMESIVSDAEGGKGGKQWRETVGRLVDGLAVMGRELGKDATVEERAAVWEMGKVVAEKAGADKAVDRAKMLSLPLAEDSSLKYTRALSLDYYRELMAGGR